MSCIFIECISFLVSDSIFYVTLGLYLVAACICLASVLVVLVVFLDAGHIGLVPLKNSDPAKIYCDFQVTVTYVLFIFVCSIVFFTMLRYFTCNYGQTSKG